MVAVNDTLPSSTLKTMGPEGPEDINIKEAFAHKKVVLFSVPGAFTPGCSLKHLPGYVTHYQAFRDHQIDTVACLSNNDPFVMDNWAEQQKAKGKILMLSDNGTLRDALDMSIDLSPLGLGIRIRRFAMILHNNVIQHLSMETGLGVDVTLSSAETILNHVKQSSS